MFIYKSTTTCHHLCKILKQFKSADDCGVCGAYFLIIIIYLFIKLTIPNHFSLLFSLFLVTVIWWDLFIIIDFYLILKQTKKNFFSFHIFMLHITLKFHLSWFVLIDIWNILCDYMKSKKYKPFYCHHEPPSLLWIKIKKK